MLERSNSSWESPKGNRGGEGYFVFVEDRYTNGLKPLLWFAEERAIFFWEVVTCW